LAAERIYDRQRVDLRAVADGLDPLAPDSRLP
jgi:hypothetical protein